MKPPDPFSDFTLMEISYLPPQSIETAKRLFERHGWNGLTAIGNIIQEKIDFAKTQIDQHTRPGDQLLIEAAEGMSFEAFIKTQGIESLEKMEPFSRRFLEQNWSRWTEKNMNMYREIAEYATQRGRIVKSFEYGVTRTGSRMHNAAHQVYQMAPEKKQRIENILNYRRHIGMQRQIERRKPAMVICAAGHAVAIEHDIHPRRVIYEDPKMKEKWGTKKSIAEIKNLIQAYLFEKQARRRKINQARTRQPPKKKPK